MACRLIAITVARLYLVRMLQRTLPAGFIAPCLPTKTDKLPSGSQWLHEIKHDGFRIITRKNGAQVRLYSRPGNDLTRRFPLIVETLARLRSRSCIIDGEAVACDDNGVASFNLIRYRRHDDSTFLYAFGLIELNGDDLRRDPLEVRKATLASIVAKAMLNAIDAGRLDHLFVDAETKAAVRADWTGEGGGCCPKIRPGPKNRWCRGNCLSGRLAPSLAAGAAQLRLHKVAGKATSAPRSKQNVLAP